MPENCIIDAAGPADDRPARLLRRPARGHPVHRRPQGLRPGIICEVLAGALTGGGCSNPANADRVANGMLSIILDPSRFQDDAAFAAEINRFIAWVKSSAKATPDGDILMPGEIEERTKAQRLRDGIDIDDTTWSQIVETAQIVGCSV